MGNLVFSNISHHHAFSNIFVSKIVLYFFKIWVKTNKKNCDRFLRRSFRNMGSPFRGLRFTSQYSPLSVP